MQHITADILISGQPVILLREIKMSHEPDIRNSSAWNFITVCGAYVHCHYTYVVNKIWYFFVKCEQHLWCPRYRTMNSRIKTIMLSMDRKYDWNIHCSIFFTSFRTFIFSTIIYHFISF
jgi:hypothetical protein